MSCVEFILNDERLSVQEAEVREQLTEMGFNTDRQNYPIAGLSGGWKVCSDARDSRLTPSR